MKFTSRYRKYQVVVRAADRQFLNGLPVVQTPLRATFVNHQFDSEKAQADHGWSDQERELVEQTLLKSPDFESGGLYLADTKPLRINPATLGDIQCLFFTFAPDMTKDQCVQTAVAGEPYCQEHMDLARAAASVSPEPVPGPVRNIATGRFSKAPDTEAVASGT